MVISFYSLSINDSSLRFYVWGRGMGLDLGEECVGGDYIKGVCYSNVRSKEELVSE